MIKGVSKMDIYVELTYCMNGILFIMTYEMISLLLNIHWSFMKILFLSFLSNISVILIYIDYLPYISFLYWFVLFLFFFKKQFFLYFPVFLIVYFSILFFINTLIKESFISDYKKEILTINFLDITKGYSFDLTYEVKVKDTQKQKKLYSDNKSKIKKSTNTKDGYHVLNNIVNIDNINIDVKSLLIKDNYSLLNFTTENKYFIQDDYIVKIKSNSFEDIFFINPIAESNSFYVPMIYKDGDLDFNNLEIYLVNVNSNEKTLIYKSNT